MHSDAGTHVFIDVDVVIPRKMVHNTQVTSTVFKPTMNNNFL